MRTFPSGSRASSRRRQVDYHSLIIDNYSRRFHWLVCKKPWFCIEHGHDDRYIKSLRVCSVMGYLLQALWQQINTGVEINTCLFQTGCHLSSAISASQMELSQITRFMGPTWGPPGSCRPLMGPTLAPWTLLSGVFFGMASVAWDGEVASQCTTLLLCGLYSFTCAGVTQSKQDIYIYMYIYIYICIYIYR